MKRVFLSSIVMAMTLSSISSAFADMSGYTKSEQTQKAQIERTIQSLPELKSLHDQNPELAILLAARLHAAKENPTTRLMRENPEAVLDLMTLIRQAAGGHAK